MAISRVGAWFNSNDKTSATTTDFTTTTAVNRNECLVALVALDNSGASGTAPGFALVLDQGGAGSQGFTAAASVTRTAGSSNDGVNLRVLYLIANNDIASGVTLRMTLSPATTAKAITIDRFTGVTNLGTEVGTEATSTGSGNLPTATKTGVTSGNLAIGAVAWETSSTTFVQDVDITNGTWVGFAQNGTSGGSAATNVQICGASKITTGTGDQSYDPTISGVDNALAVVELAAGSIFRTAAATMAGVGTLGVAVRRLITPTQGTGTGYHIAPFTNRRYAAIWQASGSTGDKFFRLMRATAEHDGWEFGGDIQTGADGGLGINSTNRIWRQSDTQVGYLHERYSGGGSSPNAYGGALVYNPTNDTIGNPGYGSLLLTAIANRSSSIDGDRMTDTKAVIAHVTDELATPGNAMVRARIGILDNSTDTAYTMGTVADLGWAENPAVAGSALRVIGLSDTRFIAFHSTTDGSTNRKLWARIFSVTSGTGTTIGNVTAWTSLLGTEILEGSDSFGWNVRKIDDTRIVLVYGTQATYSGSGGDGALKVRVIDTASDTISVGSALTLDSESSGMLSYSLGAIAPLSTTEIFVAAQRRSATASEAFGSIDSNTVSAGTSVTVTKPASTVQGDLLWAFIAIGSDNGSVTVTPPAGWTFHEVIRNSGNVGLHAYYKTAGASEGADYTFSFSSAVTAAAAVMRTTNGLIDEQTKLDELTYTGTGSSTTPTAPTAYAVRALIAVSAVNAGVTHTPPTGYTERVDISAGTAASLSIATDTGGAVGGQSAAFTITSSRPWAAMHLAMPNGDGAIVGYTVSAGASGTTASLVAGPTKFNNFSTGDWAIGTNDHYLGYATTESTAHIAAASMAISTTAVTGSSTGYGFYSVPQGVSSQSGAAILLAEAITTAAGSQTSTGSATLTATATVSPTGAMVVYGQAGLGAIRDDFARSDSTTSLGSRWTNSSGTFGITSGTAYTPSATNPSLATLETGKADGIVEVARPTLSSAGEGVCFRYIDNSNYWRFSGNTGFANTSLQKFVGGVQSNVGSYAVTNNGNLKVVLNGTSIEVYSNGVLRDTITDSDHSTATKHGLFISNNTVARLDDWSFTDLVPPGGTLTAAGNRVVYGAAILTADATTTADGLARVPGLAVLAADATTTAVPVVRSLGSATLTADATLSGQWTDTGVTGSASLSAEASASAVPSVRSLATAALSADATTTSAGLARTFALAALSADATTSAVGAVQASGAAILTATATVSAAGVAAIALVVYPTASSIVETGWFNPENAFSDNGVYATAEVPSTTGTETSFSLFGINLDPDVQILSVSLEVQWRGSNGVSDLTLTSQAYVDGSPVGSAITNTDDPQADVTNSASVPITSPADLDDASFTVRVRASRP